MYGGADDPGLRRCSTTWRPFRSLPILIFSRISICCRETRRRTSCSCFLLRSRQPQLEKTIRQTTVRSERSQSAPARPAGKALGGAEHSFFRRAGTIAHHVAPGSREKRNTLHPPCPARVAVIRRVPSPPQCHRRGASQCARDKSVSCGLMMMMAGAIATMVNPETVVMMHIVMMHRFGRGRRRWRCLLRRRRRRRRVNPRGRLSVSSG